ncbi:hypothetical protein D3C87_460200 [compost metagenome]
MAKTRNLGNLSNVLTQVGNFAQQQTPSQFDASTNLATTAFVKSASGSFSAFSGYAVSTTLTAGHAGGFVNFGTSTASQILTLPLANTLPAGACIFIQSTSSVNFTLQRQGSDTITPNGVNVTSVTIKPGDWIECIVSGASSWVVSGTAVMGFSASGAFGNNIAASGHQKLPSGIIIQWGDTGPVNATANALIGITYPLIFPTSVLSVTMNNVNTASGTAVWSINAASTTGMNVFVNVTSNVRAYWMAIGF